MLNQTDAALLSRTKVLVQELADFLQVRNELNTPDEFPHGTGRPNVAAIVQNLQEMNITYAQNFAGRAMAIVEAFKERGIEPKGAIPHIFQHPTNPLGVHEVMAELGYMAERLELREG